MHVKKTLAALLSVLSLTPAMANTEIGLQVVGNPAGAAVLSYDGGGRNVAFEQAVRAVLPDDWQLVFEAADRDAPMSWTDQKRKWPEVLSAFAHERGVSMTLDWPMKTLRVSEAMGLDEETASIRQWRSLHGETLRGMAERWASSAGWQLVWEADYDYPLTAPLAVDGNLLDAVIVTFQAFERSDRPFYVDAYIPQRLLVIKAKAERA